MFVISEDTARRFKNDFVHLAYVWCTARLVSKQKILLGRIPAISQNLCNFDLSIKMCIIQEVTSILELRFVGDIHNNSMRNNLESQIQIQI